MWIEQLLATVPDVIWSGIIASALTFSGVLISNRSNTTRLKIQLDHDRDEKLKERTSSMRRDVYLKATEELVRLNSFLASLPQQDIANSNIGEEFIGFQSASARLQLVAEPKTTLLAIKLSTAYSEIIIDLTQHLMCLTRAKSDIQIAGELYTKSSNEVQRVLSAMSLLTESGMTDSQEMDGLQKSFECYQEQASKFSSDRSAGWSAFNKGTLAFQRYLFTRMREIAPLQMNLMVEIRQDLGLLGDLSEVESEMKKQLDQIENKFITALHTLESKSD